MSEDRLDRIEGKVDKTYDEVVKLRLELVGEYVRKPAFYWGVGIMLALVSALRIFG